MNRTQIKGCIHGKFPRSAALVEISRDVDRKRRKLSELKKQYAKDTRSLLHAQKAAQLDYITDGALPWQDMFRPIIETADGFATGPLTRWFDNNCFFRQPIITGKIRLDTKKLDQWFPPILPKKKWLVTLPSPYTFAAVSQDTTTDDFTQTLGNITDLLMPLVTYLDTKGVAFIQLNEPYIPYTQVPDKEVLLFKKAIARIYEQKGEAKLAVHFSFGDAKRVLDVLAKEKIADIVGIDFYQTNLADIPTPFPYAIIAGVLDGRNSLLEKKAAVKKFIKQIAQRLQPETLYIANNSDLELLPEPVAKEKIALLGVLLKEL